jgi:hypothetical protein
VTTFDKGVGEWLASWKKENLPEDVLKLINQANFDLHHGPVLDDDEYPGFVKACRLIIKAIDDLPSVIYLNTFSGEVLQDEPDDADLNDWMVVERPQLLRELVGRELVAYVR